MFGTVNPLGCRKRGGTQAEAAHRAWTLETTPVAVPPAAKVSRTFASEVDSKLSMIVAALSAAPGCSEASLDMLKCAVHGSLAPKADERDAFQVDAANMIGRALRIIESGLGRNGADDLEAQLTALRAEAGMREAAQRDAEDALAAAKAAVDGFTSLGGDYDANRRLQEARTALRAAEQKLAQIMQKRQQVLDAYENHFLILRRALETKTRPMNAREHTEALLPLFRSWGVEESLLAGFVPAADCEKIARGDRGDWCLKVLMELEGFFQEPRQHLEQMVLEAQRMVSDHEAQLRLAEEACRAADSDRASDAARLQTLRDALRDAQARLEATKRPVSDAYWNIQRVEQELAHRSGELKRFKDGPLAAYEWLLRHGSPGSRDYYAKGRFGNVSPQVQEKLATCINCLRTHFAGPEASKEMLAAMAPGCLGPVVGERDEFQSEGCVMIGNALHLKEEALLADIGDLLPDLGRTAQDTAKLTEPDGLVADTSHRCSRISFVGSGSSAIEIAELILGEKTSSISAFDARIEDTRKAKEQARIELLAAERKLAQAADVKKILEDAYNNHFVALREGTFMGEMEASRHISVLMPLFESWNVEDCLLAGFRPAASHRPLERGEWCLEVMQGVEMSFEGPTREAETAWSACQAELLDLQRAYDSIGFDDAGRQQLVRELQVARTIKQKVDELVAFRHHCLQTYKWLLNGMHNAP